MVSDRIVKLCVSLRGLIDDGARSIRVDLAQDTVVDAAGLGAMGECRSYAVARGCEWTTTLVGTVLDRAGQPPVRRAEAEHAGAF